MKHLMKSRVSTHWRLLRTHWRSLAGALLLAGCGYQPLYQPQVLETMEGVHIAHVGVIGAKRLPGERRVAQIINEELERQFTGSQNSPYQVAVTVEESLGTLAVRRDATVQRYNLSFVSHITLSGPDGKHLLTFSKQRSATFNVENSPFGTSASQEQARRTAARELARVIEQEISIFLSQHPDAGKP